MVSPGFEAVYAGEKSSSLTEKVDINATLTTDQTGNIIRKWSTWPWTWSGREKDFGEGVALAAKPYLQPYRRQPWRPRSPQASAWTSRPRRYQTARMDGFCP